MGLGLIHFGFLAATAAVAIPIAIHLLLRPRARRVEIGSLRFLKLVLRESTRRRRLNRWLLLTLRCLIVILLALLFARPYLRGLGAEGQDQEVILLVDQSASMSAASSGRTAFAQAQEAAVAVLRRLPERAAVHLAYFDASGVYPTDVARLEPNRQPGFAGTDYAPALAWARDQLALTARAHKKVFFFTDMQRSGLRDKSPRLPPDVVVELVEVGRPLVKNLAVAGAQATQTVLRSKEPIVVTAEVVNAGAFAIKNVRVRLAVDGPEPRSEQVQTIALEAASRRLLTFPLPIQKAGFYSGYVEVAGEDDFPLDDRRWLVFDARPPDRLLLVDGRPGRTYYTDTTYYLEAALRLRLPDSTNQPLTPFETERLAWRDNTQLPELKRFSVVVLCNLSGLGERDLAQLRSFVAAGGKLLVFAGSQIQPDASASLYRAGLLPAAVEGIQGPDLFHFDTWDKDHPIFRPLSDPQQGDLRRITFRFLSKLKPDPGSKVLATAQTLGEDPSRSAPLVLESHLGQGTILLFGSTADRDWSDWPQSRLYVPLVHQMVGYLTERLPENQRIHFELAGRDKPPGVSRTDREVIVRNLDPRESEIERFTVQEFRDAFHISTLENQLEEQQGLESVKLPPGSQRPDEIWVYVVWALLLILAVELFLANRTHG